MSSGMPEATNALAEDQAMWNHWVDVVITTSSVPAVVETSGHMLYIGKKEE